MAQTLSNNIGSFNTTVVNNITAPEDQSKILAWLSPLNPGVRHQDVRNSRIENVGEWVLETKGFKNWHASSGGGGSDNAVLFCYGDPGVGKTFISSLVIDRLCDRVEGPEMAVACFYFDFAAQKEQSPVSMLGSVLKQVVSGLEEVPEEIARAYENQKRSIGGRGLLLTDVVKMLENTVSKMRTFICIDALDECVAEYRVKILDSLNKVLRSSPGTRMFVTGRSHIEAEVGKRLSGSGTAIRITPQRPDIINYLHSRLDDDTTPDAMDGNLKADILNKISKDVSEMFLLVSLNVDAILQGATISSRRKRLNEMTNSSGLEGVYGTTLSRIKAQGGEKSRLGMAALMWISHAERPLRVDELRHALGVEIGSADLDGSNVPSIGTVLACCQGLISVDKESSTVRLIHFTLQEYLQAYSELFDRPHATMGEICLSYLNSHQVKALSCCLSNNIGNIPFPEDSLDWEYSPIYSDTPFLKYSSLYWGRHANRDLSDCAKELALKIFEDYNNHISTRVLFVEEELTCFDPDEPFQSSGLHYASFFGIVEIVTDLIEVGGCDINQKDSVGNTPLVWAALGGSEGLVKILLGWDGINPDQPGCDDRTPLIWAAFRGHEGVVKMLLGRDDVNPNQPDNGGITPLCWAALRGCEGVVTILLGRDGVNPNQPDSGGKTPLCWAALNGREGVAKILLGRADVNPDQPDHNGKTPLWWAARNGHEGVVKMLLGRADVNPNKLDGYGQTPLHHAALNGHSGIVKILLGRGDINPDKQGWLGITPLCGAAISGYKEVVRILLERDDVNPNQPDSDGKTPLYWATLGQDEGMLESLFGRGGVDPMMLVKPSRALVAAKDGHERVVEMLLRRGDVNPNQPDCDGKTPLCWAALNGREEVVKILLGRADVNPDQPDEDDQTPLSHAAVNRHEGVVKILLERDDISPNKSDKYSQTPLRWATSEGREGVVRVPLRRDDANPAKRRKLG